MTLRLRECEIVYDPIEWDQIDARNRTIPGELDALIRRHDAVTARTGNNTIIELTFEFQEDGEWFPVLGWCFRPPGTAEDFRITIFGDLDAARSEFRRLYRGEPVVADVLRERVRS